MVKKTRAPGSGATTATLLTGRHRPEHVIHPWFMRRVGREARR